MSADSSDPITELLIGAENGDPVAQERLWLLLYQDLHRVAQRQMTREAAGHTLQPTALVNEAYLRLVGAGDVRWENRRQFFAAAANTMRRIRVDYARKRGAEKRGGGRRPDRLDDALVSFDTSDDVIEIDEALTKLELESPARAKVVLLRYFAGMNREEIATVVGISVRTVDNYWRLARAWLHKELS